MAFEMVDGDERQAADERDRLCRHRADDDAADQAGTAGEGDAVEVAEIHRGLGEGAGDQRIEGFKMGARRDLRHHAAVRPMLGKLRAHQIGENPPVARVGDHRRRRLVAARLDARTNAEQSAGISPSNMAKTRREMIAQSRGRSEREEFTLRGWI